MSKMILFWRGWYVLREISTIKWFNFYKTNFVSLEEKVAVQKHVVNPTENCDKKFVIFIHLKHLLRLLLTYAYARCKKQYTSVKQNVIDSSV